MFHHFRSRFPWTLRPGTLNYFWVLGLLLTTIGVGTFAILMFERNTNSEVQTLEDAFWFSVYSLFSGEPIPGPPVSLGGRVVAVIVILMNVTLFAMLTGTISAFMVERLRKENWVNWDEFRDHTIICGWNRKAEIIVREYKAAGKLEEMPIVVIAFVDDKHTVIDPELRPYVRFLNDDFTKVKVLEKAGIRRASTCIILSDKSYGRSDQDADARTILAALTAEKLNRDVYTCAELINREYGSHLDLGQVNSYVVSQEHSGFLLAQSALNHGLMSVFSELLTYEKGNHFYRISLEPGWVGKSFLELFLDLKQNHNTILIAVYKANDQFVINPQNYQFQPGDNLIVIADRDAYNHPNSEENGIIG